MDQYRETRRELRLSPENICQVVQVGLALAGQPPLIPFGTTKDTNYTKKEEAGNNDEKVKRFVELDRANLSCDSWSLPRLNGSWAACAEGLEHPHTKELRPITFDESVSRGRDDVVLVHLNHRLPQMCLRLLRAEVWAEKGRSAKSNTTRRFAIRNDQC